MEHHIRISMTESHAPTDNAVAERQNGILKNEHICLQDMYQDYGRAKLEIGNAIEFHNTLRPHMSIGMKRPMDVYRGEEPGRNLWKKDR